MKKTKLMLVVFFAVVISSCNKNSDINLGSNYRLVYSSNYPDVVIVKEHNIRVIAPHILKYVTDSTFIIVEQKPRDSVPECTGKIPGMTLDKSQEAFKKSKLRLYWILNKKQKSIFDRGTEKYSNIYGPFKEEEYLKKREELGVPKDLQLKETNLD